MEETINTLKGKTLLPPRGLDVMCLGLLNGPGSLGREGVESEEFV